MLKSSGVTTKQTDDEKRGRIDNRIKRCFYLCRNDKNSTARLDFPQTIMVQYLRKVDTMIRGKA